VTRLLIGRAGAATDELAAALGAVVEAAPDVRPELDADGWSWTWAPAVDAWADRLAAGPPAERVAVCTWAPAQPATAMAELDAARWVAEVEVELATWSRAVVAAAARCAPGGSVVVVAERPSALDANGRVTTLAVGEGLATFARSAALVHGARRVRVNVVATALWTVPDELLGMPPALPDYPGTVAREVAGAVRALWSDDACGITGTVVRADAGRSW
jgi:hypothetical protein